MRAGHIMYIVSDLEKEVEKYENMGFKVEYGSKEKNNALIFFSKGPYVELCAPVNFPEPQIDAIKKMGGSSFINMMSKDIVDKELGNFCIEKDPGDLLNEIEELKKLGEQGFYYENGKRIDLENNTLTWKLFFPNNLGLPFLMSYFDNGMDPKPVDFIHPNGKKGIKKIVFQSDSKSIENMKQLVDDDIIEYVVGEPIGVVTSIEFE